MAVEIMLRAVGGEMLVAATALDAEAIAALRPGRDYRAQLTHYRHGGFHRKFFALLAAAYGFEQIAERFASQERWLDALKLAVGHCEVSVLYDPASGRVREIIRPRSISFAAMDQLEFEAFYSAVLDAILQRYLQGVSRDELERQSEIILGYAP